MCGFTNWQGPGTLLSLTHTPYQGLVPRVGDAEDLNWWVHSLHGSDSLDPLTLWQ